MLPAITTRTFRGEFVGNDWYRSSHPRNFISLSISTRRALIACRISFSENQLLSAYALEIAWREGSSLPKSANRSPNEVKRCIICSLSIVLYLVVNTKIRNINWILLLVRFLIALFAGFEKIVIFVPQITSVTMLVRVSVINPPHKFEI